MLSLLEAKLAPPRVPQEFIVRPRVSDLFDAGARKQLTVVSAGPGWGKTLAAAAWARSTGVARVAWLSLDEADSEPRLFWAYVLAALRRTGVVPPDNDLAELVPGFSVDEEIMRRILQGLSQLPETVALVLDDFHNITDPQVISGVEMLLRYEIAQTRLVLIARMDPTLPLHRLRLSGELTEIRAADLAFSADEATALIGQHGGTINADRVTRLLGRTEGWVAGLRLAALALRSDPTGAGLDEDADEDRAVADYLADQVLMAQPQPLREFLIRTSILDRVTGELADAVTGERRGQNSLEQLDRGNAFVIRLGGPGHWYRYHPMLTSMLLDRLSNEHPEAVAGLHRRAAMWFAARDHSLEAVRHAISAEDVALVCALLANRVVPRLLSVEREAFGRLLDHLPAVVPDDCPELHLCRAARCLAKADFASIAVHVSRAWETVADLGTDVQPAARVCLHLLSNLLGRIDGDASAMIAHSGQALSLLRGDAADIPAADDYVAIALSNLGTGLFWSGSEQEAEAKLTQAMAATDKQRVEMTLINVRGHLGVCAAQAGRLREAHEHGAAAVSLAETRGWDTLEQLSCGYLSLALVSIHRNAPEEAERLVNKGLAAQPNRVDRLPLTGLSIARVRALTGRRRLAQARGELDALRAATAQWEPPELLTRWLDVAEAELDLACGDRARAIALDIRADSGSVTDQERVCKARALIADGEADLAEQMVAPLLEWSTDRGAEVEAWLLTALVADHARQDHRATRAAQQALLLAMNLGFRRPFTLFDPALVARLIERAARLDRALAGYADEVLADVSHHHDRRPGSGPAAPLTDRELMVLQHLPTMLNNAEIAAEMYLSVNTVKAHVKSLYRKLDVSSRRAAVERARELNLLTPGSGSPP